MIWMTFENMANWVKKGQGFFCFRPPQKQTRQQKTFSHASPPYRKITVKMQHWKLVALMETSTSDIFWALLRIHGNQLSRNSILSVRKKFSARTWFLQALLVSYSVHSLLESTAILLAGKMR